VFETDAVGSLAQMVDLLTFDEGTAMKLVAVPMSEKPLPIYKEPPGTMIVEIVSP
jgi:hypothetical protein